MKKEFTLQEHLEYKRIDLTYSYLDEMVEFIKTFKDNDNNRTIIRTTNTKKLEYSKNDSLDGEINSSFKNIKHKKFNEKQCWDLYGVENLHFSINSFNNKFKNRNLGSLLIERNGRKFINISNKQLLLASINCIVFDIDMKDNLEYTEEQIINLVKKVKEPTYIINSGNGYHVYYKTFFDVSDFNITKLNGFITSYKNTCKVLDYKFKSVGINTDPKVVGDVSRILKLPYCLNNKDKNNFKQTYICYKNLDAVTDYLELQRKCKKLYHCIKKEKVNSVKHSNVKDYKNSYGSLESFDLLPNNDYPIRKTNYTNYSIFLKDAIKDIKFLIKHKNYEGRRHDIMYHLGSVINKYNIECQVNKNWFPINLEDTLNEINEVFELPKNEMNNLIKSSAKSNGYTNREYLIDIMGVNEIDETHMYVLCNSEKEMERRKQLKSKRYNDINNKKRSDKSKKSKIEKQMIENEKVSNLINNHSLREISKLTGFSLGKVQSIIKRLK